MKTTLIKKKLLKSKFLDFLSFFDKIFKKYLLYSNICSIMLLLIEYLSFLFCPNWKEAYPNMRSAHNLINAWRQCKMFEKELRCPHCHKLVGKVNASEKSTAKVLKFAPKESQTKSMAFENKCPKCNNLIYTYLGFIDK